LIVESFLHSSLSNYYHGLLGYVFYILILYLGATLTGFCGITSGQSRFLRYPIGLLCICLLSAVLGFLPFIVTVIISPPLIIFALVIHLRNRCLEYTHHGGFLKRVPLLGLILILSEVLGNRFHGPSPTAPSAIYGDTVHYAAVMSSWALDPFRRDDLLVYGLSNGLANSSVSILGSTLLREEIIDPILFLSVTIPVLGILATGDMIKSLFTSKTGNIKFGHAVLSVVLILASIPYIGWIVESPPVMLAIPLAVCVAGLYLEFCRKEGKEFLRELFIFSAAFYITKIGMSLMLAPLFVRHILRTETKWWKKLMSVLVALATTTFIVLENQHVILSHYDANFWVFELTPSKFSEFSTQWLKIENILLLLGLSNLIGFQKPFERIFLILFIIVAFTFSTLFSIMYIGCAVWLITTLNFEQLSKLRVLASTVLLLGSIFARDYSSIHELMIIIIILIFLVLALTDRQQLKDNSIRFLLKELSLIMGVIACFLVTNLYMYRFISAELYPEDFDIWRMARIISQEDAIIFTDQTGLDTGMSTGWNSYAALSRRQIYLAGWYHSVLRVSRDELLRRISTNDAVISGLVDPRTISARFSTSDIYIILRHREPPPGSTQIYSNKLYAIFKRDD